MVVHIEKSDKCYNKLVKVLKPSGPYDGANSELLIFFK